MDEQEAAQKLLSRKLEVLETGFGVMQGILYPKVSVEADDLAADESRIPFLDNSASERTLPPHHQRMFSGDSSADALSPFDFPVPPTSRPSSAAPGVARRASPIGLPPSESAAALRQHDPFEAYTTDYDLTSPGFPPPSTSGGPYVSPLHHLLSMHESLRDEMSRVNSALQELDGRHSMQTLNENLRTREEISYLGAQLAGLSRQVHWLTSTQLQRQSRSATPSAVAGSSSEMAGTSVEAAVNAVSTAATALRGAARMVSVGQGQSSSGSHGPMRRENSAEGRTKL
ncbi:hypothetical protein LTR86_001352 [Recurvomyces mirabilis]|nr:hypothetical protein LTR86_001352 [Recurvomyces mirabilis]